jgi:hypothetical protein
MEGPNSVNICGQCAELSLALVAMMKSEGKSCAICSRPESEAGWFTIVLGGPLVCPFCIQKLVEKALAEKHQT